MKTNWKTLVAVVLTVILSCSSALACTSLYVGSDFTEDGATILARSEDLANSRNKVYYVSPAGNHKAGEFYQGCYGFTYTFTHDSYGYNAFRDDNLEGVDYVCPNCGGTHAHTPYEEGGANEMGLMVSASEALTAGKELLAVDPFEEKPAQTPNARIKNALAYLNPAYDFSETDPEKSLYCITNIDEAGNIVPMHTGIELDGSFNEKKAIDFYKVDGVSNDSNLETHIFHYFTGTEPTNILEWVSMENSGLNVFVPYYPLLTTDVAAPYIVATGLAYFSEEKPESGAFYPATSRVKTEEGTVTVEGYRVLPEKWDESYYWTVDAISNIMKYGTPSDEVKALVVDSLAAKQQEIYDAFITMKADIAAAEDPAKVSTDASMAMAYDVFEMLSGLAKELTK